MAKVYKCDRCGAIFENEDKGHTKETDPCLDLCLNCYHEYLSWLDENKTKCDSDEKNILEIYICDDNLDLRPGKIEILVYDCTAKRYVRFQGIDMVKINKRLVKSDGIEETED